MATIDASPALKNRLVSIERALSVARKQLSTMSEAIKIQPPIGSMYRCALMQLREHLRADTIRARKLLADILEPVRLETAEDDQVWAEMQTGRSIVMAGQSTKLVAGAGFEPTTFGL